MVDFGFCYKSLAALLAGTPWLDVFCPGCGTSHAIDLRTIDRHSLASVGTLVLAAARSRLQALGGNGLMAGRITRARIVSALSSW
jgi:hypothetical protein